jgi:hypothetical protein
MIRAVTRPFMVIGFLLFAAQSGARLSPQNAANPAPSGRVVFLNDNQYGGRQSGDEELQKRIAILEASRADLSVWATIFVGVVALLVAANVGLSVWQVGSIARKEADAVIDDYNKRFAGFLTSGEQEIQKSLDRYQSTIDGLSRRMDELSASMVQYASSSSNLTAEIRRAVVDGIASLELETQRLKSDPSAG